jgi:hypothetical protein
MSSQFIRVAPESERGYYLEKQDFLFKFPQINTLQGSTLRLEGNLIVFKGNAPAGAYILPGDAPVYLPYFGGLNCMIAEITVASPTLGVLDRITNYGQMVSMLYATEKVIGDTSLCSRGCAEGVSGCIDVARRLTIGTNPAIANAGGTIVDNRLKFSLILQSGLLTQNLPLGLTGGLEITVRLTSNQQFFLDSGLVGAQMQLGDVYLTANLLPVNPKNAVLTWPQVETHEKTMRSGLEIISTTTSTQATSAVIMTFNNRSNLYKADENEYALMQPNLLTELNFSIGGSSAPLSYRVLCDASIDGLSGSEEAIELALSALGSNTICKRPCVDIYPGYQWVAGDPITDWFVCGVPLPTPVDFTMTPFSVSVQYTYLADMACYIFFIGTKSMKL